jgi:ribosomal protein S24E
VVSEGVLEINVLDLCHPKKKKNVAEMDSSSNGIKLKSQLLNKQQRQKRKQFSQNVNHPQKCSILCPISGKYGMAVILSEIHIYSNKNNLKVNYSNKAELQNVSINNISVRSIYPVAYGLMAVLHKMHIYTSKYSLRKGIA